MSDELRLPDDLAACEARLAAAALPAAAVNRDELFYRAGWAACEARRSDLDARNPTRATQKRMLALCSLGSAVAAAALAVAMTWPLRATPGSAETAHSVPRAGRASVADHAASAPMPVVAKSTAAPANRIADFTALDGEWPARTGPLLAFGRWSRGGDSPRPAPGVDSSEQTRAPAAKTVQQLRQELLPASVAPLSQPAGGARDWPWNLHFWRETT